MADVRMPDGTVITNVPESATREDILKVWDAARRPQSTAARSSVWQGMKDPVYGLAQIAGRGIAAVGGDWGKENLRLLEGVIAEDESDYQAKRKSDGMDWGRIGGNILTTFPLSAGSTAATLLGRTAQAARTGAIVGATQPVYEGDFAGTKAKQIAGGTIAGAVMQPAGEAALRGAAAATNKIADKIAVARGYLSGESAQSAAQRILTDALGRQWDDLSEAVKQSLADDVAQALRTSGVINPDALRRLADFRAQGIDPRPSWLTRDPVAWTKEENLAGVAGAEPLMRLREQADKKLLGAIDGLSPRVGGDAYQLGAQSMAGVKAADDALKRNVDTAYEMFRKAAPDIQGNGMRFVNRVSQALDEKMVGGQLPSDYVARLQKIASGEFPITPSTLYQMQKAASDSRGNPALAIFKKAVDDELAAMVGSGGGTQMELARRLLGEGRHLARERFQLHDAAPAFEKVAAGEATPERFFEQFIVGAKADQVAKMWMALPDQSARQAIRQQFVDYLKRAATGAAQDEGAPFAQATFNKTIAAPGMREKLQIVLGKKGLEEVLRTGRNAEAAKLMPAGHKVNTSNTSQGVANFAMRLLGEAGKVASVGPAIGGVANAMRTNAAMRAPADVIAQRAQFGPDPEMAAWLASFLAAPAAGATSGLIGR